MIKEDKTKNVFVSHYREDEENIQKMQDLLTSKGYCVRNSSIDSTKENRATDEDYIKSMLRPRIEWAGAFICLIGRDTHTRPWVNWEIEEAQRQGKRIVGVYIPGATDSNLPTKFKDYGTALVGWNGDRIIGAIEGKINNFEDPDGSERPRVWFSSRSNC